MLQDWNVGEVRMLHNHIDVSRMFGIEPNDGEDNRVPKKKKKILKRKLPNETSG
jgi:hypothetical protein